MIVDLQPNAEYLNKERDIREVNHIEIHFAGKRFSINEKDDGLQVIAHESGISVHPMASNALVLK